jgi:hypothetical protein
MKRSNSTKRKLGAFASAAVFYAAGVTAFSGWSYVAHRTALLENVDVVLKNGACATREILGIPGTVQLDSLESIERSPGVSRSDQLSRHARNGEFKLIGSLARIENDTHSLIVDQRAVVHSSEVADTLAALAFDLAGSVDQGMAMLTLNDKTYGMLRVAMIYEGVANGPGMAYFVAKDMDAINGRLKALTIEKAATGLFLLVMAIPLIALYSRMQSRVTHELSSLNARLQQDVEVQRQRESELKEAMHDLERFTAVSAGRETRIIELKAEVNELLGRLKFDKRYNMDKT